MPPSDPDVTHSPSTIEMEKSSLQHSTTASEEVTTRPAPTPSTPSNPEIEGLSDSTPVAGIVDAIVKNEEFRKAG